VWRQLGQLDAARHQHEEYVGLVPFVEKELAGVGLFRIRQADDLRERVQREPLEQRDMQESTGDLGHILNGHVESSSCHISSVRGSGPGPGEASSFEARGGYRGSTPRVDRKSTRLNSSHRTISY